MTNDSDPLRTPEPEARGSIGDLVRRLLDDVRLLFRQEVALAKLEVRQAVSTVLKRVGEMAAGGGVILVGALVLIAFLIIGLGALLGDRYWLSSLIVTLVLFGGGAALVFAGTKKLGEASLAPEEAMDSLRTTKEWAALEATRVRAALTEGGDAGGEAIVRAPSAGLPPGSRSVTLPAPPPERRPLPATRESASIAVVAERGAAVSSAGARQGAETRRSAGGDDEGGSDESLIKRVIHEIGDDDVVGQGAKVAYYMFTSLPPALLVLFALSGFFGGADLADYLTTQLQNVMPGSADDPDSAAGFLSQFIEDVATERAPGPLSIGLLTGLWAASAVFTALADALNRAYDVEESRSWVRRKAIALLVMIGFLALFLAGSAVLIIGPQIAGAIELYGAADLAWSILQWPLAFGLVVGAFFLAYYALPDRDQSASKRRILLGAAIGAALWLVATLGFRIYISNFGSYSETYGFVGAILVLLLWMYITGIVILVGGEFGSELEREAR